MSKLNYFVSLLVVFALSACGGGGDSDSGAGSTEPVSTDMATAPAAGSSGNEFAGTYRGRADLIFTILGTSQTGARTFTIVISDGGSVTVTGEDQSVSGSLSGNRIVASIPVAVSQNGVSCSGTLGLDASIGNNSIAGRVSGTIPCNVGPAAVRGSLTAS